MNRYHGNALVTVPETAIGKRCDAGAVNFASLCQRQPLICGCRAPTSPVGPFRETSTVLQIFFILAIGVLGTLLLFGPMLWRVRRRRLLRQQPFPEAWRQILRRHLPYYRRLPPDLQMQLKKHMQIFLAEKVFVGCDGLTVTEEMRVTIAAQACLLLLNRPTDYYPQLSQILIYPSAFVVNRAQTDAAGLVSDQARVLSGESWQQGQVILSWHDTVVGAHDPDDGRNVVLHEFAHQLDQENGQANGSPRLARNEHYPRWAAVLAAEFAQLQAKARQGIPSLIDGYGASNPAEFFAVVTEHFFEQPAELASQHPALYQEFRQFYRVDPLSWS